MSEREPQPLLVLAELRCTAEGDAALREHAARGILTFDEWNPARSRGRIEAPLLLIASRAKTGSRSSCAQFTGISCFWSGS